MGYDASLKNLCVLFHHSPKKWRPFLFFNMKILIIEDEPSLREVMLRALKEEGYVVLESMRKCMDDWSSLIGTEYQRSTI